MIRERVRFKSRDNQTSSPDWEVIKAGARSVDIQSMESGRILYSISRDRLVTVTTSATQEEP